MKRKPSKRKRKVCFDLEQTRAGEVEANKKFFELKERVHEEIYLFKCVKYEQSYRDRAQGKPPRYPLEADVRGDQVDFVSLVSIVPPALLLLR